MFLPVLLSISKFFTCIALVSFVQHSCHTRIVHVALVLHLCCTCVALVLLVSHLCCNHVASIALMLHLCRLYRTHVAYVWHSCCKLDQIDENDFKFLVEAVNTLVIKIVFVSLFLSVNERAKQKYAKYIGQHKIASLSNFTSEIIVFALELLGKSS